jgi:hypothetical protein
VAATNVWVGVATSAAQHVAGRPIPASISYVGHDRDLDVWDLLHTRRDIPVAFVGGRLATSVGAMVPDQSAMVRVAAALTGAVHP